MTGSCDTNLSNYDCGKETYCAGPVYAPCISCSLIKEGYKCNCTRESNKTNCSKCNGTKCAQCLKFYVLTDDSCVLNSCSAFQTDCANNNRCVATSVERTDCVSCVKGQTEQCTCGDKTNCETCDSSGIQCQSCLAGYEIAIGNCILKQNICNQYSQNELCLDNYFCNGVFGDFCQSCTQISPGQSCKCFEQNIKNCVKCSQTGCQQCLPLYAVQFGSCQLNTCGQVQNTLNCAFNYLCLPGSAPNTECVQCNGQANCNCGTLGGCKTCGPKINTCGSCFPGFFIQNDACVRIPNTCSENNHSGNCYPGYFCSGAFGQACESCEILPLNRSCQCGEIQIQNCTSCSNKNCKTCLAGMFPVNNVCVVNTCLGGQNSLFCAIQNFCPSTPLETKVNCQLCDKNSPVACNCQNAKNCATCDASAQKCDLCLNGFVNKGDICVQQANICDSVQSSRFCDSGSFCNGLQGEQCVSCNGIKIGFSCFCDGNLQLNCRVCDGSVCKVCLQGYLPFQGQCQPNICDEKLTNLSCQNGFICAGKTPGADCQACVSDQKTPCKCGIADNCATCGVTENTCSECIPGTSLNSILQCQAININSTNICDPESTSLKCDSNSFCQANPGDNCIPCGFLTTGKKCNCDGSLQENCQYCLGRECQICIQGFAPINGVCVNNTCGTDRKGCQNNFYCPPDYQPETHCRECNFYITDECKCGTASNCQTCSLVENQCQSCLDSFFLLNGQCIPPQICNSSANCPKNKFCQINGICLDCQDQQVACSCESAQNCQKCGISGACLNCIDGWIQDVYGSCSIPVCNIPQAINQYCAGPNQNKQCPTNPLLIETMIHPCYCGPNIDGCANCKVSSIGCKDCLNDYTMMSGTCVFTPPGYTGSCDQNNGASLCISGMGCKNYGQCVQCSELGIGNQCKCDNDTIQTNCLECDKENCKVCAQNSILIDKTCREYCNQSSQCKDNTMCDIKTFVCVACDGKFPCKCGESVNCLQCNAKLQCNGCLEGYILDSKGQCNICDEGFQIISKNPTICLKYHDNSLEMSGINIAGCCLAVIIILIAIILIIRKYTNKPKRFSFQHRITI